MSTVLEVNDDARSLLNDQIASLWTDAVLLPLLNEAYRELQTKLKSADCPIQIAQESTVLAASAVVFVPANIIEPIRGWERPSINPDDTTYVRMTEKLTLPFLNPGATLNVWQWDGTQINFIGATANTKVLFRFFAFNVPLVLTSDNIPFINAENYLSPRLASLANQSIGEATQCTYYENMANMNLDEVIKSNRGINATNKFRP